VRHSRSDHQKRRPSQMRPETCAEGRDTVGKSILEILRIALLRRWYALEPAWRQGFATDEDVHLWIQTCLGESVDEFVITACQSLRTEFGQPIQTKGVVKCHRSDGSYLLEIVVILGWTSLQNPGEVQSYHTHACKDTLNFTTPRTDEITIASDYDIQTVRESRDSSFVIEEFPVTFASPDKSCEVPLASVENTNCSQ
jgi:hypothetical protein